MRSFMSDHIINNFRVAKVALTLGFAGASDAVFNQLQKGLALIGIFFTFHLGAEGLEMFEPLPARQDRKMARVFGWVTLIQDTDHALFCPKDKRPAHVACRRLPAI